MTLTNRSDAGPSDTHNLHPAGRTDTGLTDADHARIAAAHDAARTASTRAVYRYAWRPWERWCTDRGTALTTLSVDGAVLHVILGALHERLGRLVPRLDAVLLNAGAQYDDRRQSSIQGVEATFAVNVVAQHVLLSGLEALLAPAAHVVLMGSSTHRGRRASFGLVPDPAWEAPEVLAVPDDGPRGSGSTERHRGGVAYASSKLALVTLAHRWARRLGSGGHRVNVYDPGLVAGTGLGRDMPAYRYLVWRWLMPVMSVLPGATTPARTARHAVSMLLGDREAFLQDGYVEMGRVTAAEPVTFDPERQDQLWAWLQSFTAAMPRHEPEAG